MQNLDRKISKLLKWTTHSVSIESTLNYNIQHLTLIIQFCTYAIASEANKNILFSNKSSASQHQCSLFMLPGNHNAIAWEATATNNSRN